MMREPSNSAPTRRIHPVPRKTTCPEWRGYSVLTTGIPDMVADIPFFVKLTVARVDLSAFSRSTLRYNAGRKLWW
jgi:hypothetical protein